MKPIAISFKDYHVNPFTNRGGGELVVVHRCLNCGKVSSNRIAGDDSEYQILSILKESLSLDKKLARKLQNIGLHLITKSNINEAFISLLGINYQKYLKNFGSKD